MGSLELQIPRRAGTPAWKDCVPGNLCGIDQSKGYLIIEAGHANWRASCERAHHYLCPGTVISRKRTQEADRALSVLCELNLPPLLSFSDVFLCT